MTADSLDVFIKEADRIQLDDAESSETLYNYIKRHLELPDLDWTDSAEVYWRMARACRLYADDNTDDAKRKEITLEGFEYVKKGLQKDPNHWACHKWMGIFLDLVARHEGTKKRIENAYLVRDHLQKAIAANPDDATTIHAYGQWCFTVADLSWLERKAASVFFATPPESSYKDALENFEKAEQANPGFYSQNQLYLGKCYLRLKDPAKAKTWLLKTLEFDGDAYDDRQAKKEAAELLKKL